MSSGHSEMMNLPGTAGYERDIDGFIEAVQGLCFQQVCAEFVPFLPESPARVLDLGSGAGQNAAALAALGYEVVAVEPFQPFLDAARSRYRNLSINWINDSFPQLEKLDVFTEDFHFVLVEAVWHHLDPLQRTDAFDRINSLMQPGGKVAISLRNGPAGMGIRTFSTDVETTLRQAQALGLRCILRKENLPSILPNKEKVRWNRLVFEKPES